MHKITFITSGVVGYLTLARLISLYEVYKMTLGVAGHIAAIGVFKGAGNLFFAKLVRLFEPETLTLVHGFDWFQGAIVTAEEKFVQGGECTEDYERLAKVIAAQELDNIVDIHNLDIAKDLERFFSENKHLQFKLIFVDCGIYDVVASTIIHFWPRLTAGGMMMFDRFNHEVAPGKTRAMRELLPHAKMRSFSFGSMPTAYVVKD